MKTIQCSKCVASINLANFEASDLWEGRKVRYYECQHCFAIVVVDVTTNKVIKIKDKRMCSMCSRV